MNILVINLDKEIFRPGSKSLDRLKEYSNLADKIFVIVWTKEKAKPIIFDSKLFVYPTNSGFKLKYYFDTFKIFKKIKTKHKIDLMFTQDPFETGLAGWLIKKIYKIPLQLQIHTDCFSQFFRRESWLNKIRFLLAKFLIPRADCFRAVSQRLKNKLVDEFNVKEEKITVVPIYSERITHNVERITRNDSKFIFLTVGRLVSVKNIKMQIKAIKNLELRITNYELWIVGDGENSQKLKIESEKIGIKDKVKFLGWHDDLEKFYSQADVFLLTSNYEGWGMAVIEAASYGLPIIMTDVGCANEAIKDGQSGAVIPVGNQEKLEEAMIELIQNNKLRKKLGENAKQAIMKLPSKKETLELYKKSWETALIN